MAANRAEELHDRFMEAFNKGDLEGLVALYERNAVLTSPEGEALTGWDGIRQTYTDLLGMGGKIQIETKAAFLSTDGLALLHGKWTVQGSGPGGATVSMEGRNSEVARRQPDGTWLFVIDNPFSP